MEPLESILHVLGRNRRTQVSPCSRGWCWKAQCSPKTSHHLPVLHAQLRKCGIDLPVGGLLCHRLANKSSGCMAARGGEGHVPATCIFHEDLCSWPPAWWGPLRLCELAAKSSLQVHR